MTFLSVNVYNLIVSSNQAKYLGDHKCVTEDCLFDWSFIRGRYPKLNGSIFNQTDEWFSEAVKRTWSFVNYVGDFVLTLDSGGLQNVFKLCSWCVSCEEVEELYSVNKENSSVTCLEAVLRITALFERGLGNIFLLKGSQVPFLLRDLIDTSEIKTILESETVLLMQLIFGCVKGLNIRNVAWHGFISESEINPNLLPALLVLCSSIGHRLNERKLVVLARPQIEVQVYQEFSQMLEDCAHAVPQLPFYEAIEKSSCISFSQKTFWMRAFDLFLQKWYGQSVVLLLPLLEHFLRTVFCQVNECPSNIMTAESDTFYLILDEILSPSYKDKDNQLIEALGDDLFEALLDLFSSPFGPRLRDRLSHGEIPLSHISETLANHVFYLALYSIFKSSRDKVFPDSTTNDKILGYQSRFSVFASCKKSLLHNCHLLQETDKLPRPVLEELSSSSCLEEACLTIFSHCQNSTDLILFFEKELFGQNKTSFRMNKQEVDLTSTTLRISSKVNILLKGLKVTANAKYLSWTMKTMRSRTRANYFRMWTCLPMLFSTLICLVGFQISILRLESNNEEPTIFERLLKEVEHYIDVCISLSDVDKNRWDELKSLTSEKVKMFLNYCNILNLTFDIKTP